MQRTDDNLTSYERSCLAQDAAAHDETDRYEREYMARDFYEEAKAGIVPWPCGHRTTV